MCQASMMHVTNEHASRLDPCNMPCPPGPAPYYTTTACLEPFHCTAFCYTTTRAAAHAHTKRLGVLRGTAIIQHLVHCLGFRVPVEPEGWNSILDSHVAVAAGGSCPNGPACSISASQTKQYAQ